MLKLLLACLILYSCNAFPAVYKWTDGQGKIHYSDKPNSAATKMENLESSPANHSSNEVNDENASERPEVDKAVEHELVKEAQKYFKKMDKAEARRQANNRQKRCQFHQDKLEELESSWDVIRRDSYSDRTKTGYLLLHEQYENNLDRACQ